MDEERASVLVVGGSLVGLSAAVFLAKQGVRTLVVERHAGSSAHPRAIGYTARTMESYRAAGLGARIPQVPVTARLRRAKVSSLVGHWEEEPAWTPDEGTAPPWKFSPCTGAAIAQDRLEPILRERARELGADVRMETELVRFEQDAAGVTAVLRPRAGAEYTVHADYLVAADGHRSPIRAALGIGRTGRGHLRTARSVLFRAPLEPYLASGISQFSIAQPDFEAFLTTYGDGRWVLFLRDDEEHDEATLRALIHRSIGRTDVPVEIVTTGRWEVSALIADRFASGRVFLAGDAAHTLPPNRGGYGANTGIDDAHNLAWKLAAVVSGASSPALLDTYDVERRPIAWLRHDQIFARPDFKAFGPRGNDTDAPVPLIDDAAMELGALYRSTPLRAGRSAAVMGAPDTLPPALRPDLWAGQPGTRAPHAWLDAEETRSTLDLLQDGWVLLCDDARWADAAAKASGALAIPLAVVRIGDHTDGGRAVAIRSALGIDDTGASLVRPDGYVAFRAPRLPSDAPSALTAALAQVARAVRGVR